jgi:hypothetical protein
MANNTKAKAGGSVSSGISTEQILRYLDNTLGGEAPLPA